MPTQLTSRNLEDERVVSAGRRRMYGKAEFGGHNRVGNVKYLIRSRNWKPGNFQVHCTSGQAHYPCYSAPVPMRLKSNHVASIPYVRRWAGLKMRAESAQSLPKSNTLELADCQADSMAG
jgi:hypothetical protein